MLRVVQGSGGLATHPVQIGGFTACLGSRVQSGRAGNIESTSGHCRDLRPCRKRPDRGLNRVGCARRRRRRAHSRAQPLHRLRPQGCQMLSCRWQGPPRPQPAGTARAHRCRAGSCCCVRVRGPLCRGPSPCTPRAARRSPRQPGAHQPHCWAAAGAARRRRHPGPAQCAAGRCRQSPLPRMREVHRSGRHPQNGPCRRQTCRHPQTCRDLGPCRG
jgi:hypothetical protein